MTTLAWSHRSKTLILHALSETDPSVTPAALRLDSVHLYFFSAAPLHRKA